jgi:CubicO group peptidase (beta-lactamase class C family)
MRIRGYEAGTIAANVAAILGLVLGVQTPVAAQAGSSEAAFDAVFAEFDTPHTPGCAAAVTKNGVVRYRQGYGMANLEYGIPITPSSVFHVASVSKQFTAMAVALLVEEGKVSWGDDIRTYAPEVPDFGETVTLRHLVTHTSGIRDQWSLLSMAGWRWEADVVKQEDVLDLTNRQTALNFPPGSEYLYSNTGFTLLGVVVERVTGQTLREFTRERIFEPLGMTSTHFHDDHEMIVENRAYAYDRDEEAASGFKISIPDFDVVGATSLFTTVEDMARWDRNFETARVGGAGALADLLERGKLRSGERIAYAGGLVHSRYRGLDAFGHGGADAGYRSNYVRFPDQGLAVVVLCNFPWSNPGALARRIADVYLGLGPVPDDDAPPRGSTVEASVRDAVAGAYALEDSDIPIRLIPDGEQLRAAQGTGRGQPLRGRQDGGFEVVGTGTDLWLSVPGESEAIRVKPAEGPAKIARRLPEARSVSELAPELVGDYHSAELGAWYRVGSGPEGLFLWNRKHGRLTLEPVAGDVFRSDFFFVTFSRDPEGRVQGFTVSSGRVWKVRFDRRERPESRAVGMTPA